MKISKVSQRKMEKKAWVAFLGNDLDLDRLNKSSIFQPKSFGFIEKIGKI